MAIVSTGHDVADARLHRTVGALRRAGCQVEVRALTEQLAAGKLTRALRALIWPWQMRCDVLVTIDPDTALSAWLSAKLLRRRWVADVHEDYRELLRDRAWVPGPLLAVLRAAVSGLNRLITRADLVLVADEHVPPRHAPRRFVMRNVPDVTLLPAMPEPAPSGSNPAWRAAYIGDNRTTRGLRDMVEAIAATVEDDNAWALDLVGPVAAADRAWLDARLTEPDARNITWHGRQPPAESWRIAAGASVGLCLLADTPAFRDAMPSKVYEYLAMGMPTLATPLPRVRELLEGTGAGTVVDGVPATVAELRRFASDAAHRATLLSNARTAGEGLRQRPSPYDEAARRIAALAVAGQAGEE